MLRGDNPTNIYFHKVNNRNTRNRPEICSKLAIQKQERRQWYHSVVFVVSFEQFIMSFSSASILYFEHVNVYWGPDISKHQL